MYNDNKYFLIHEVFYYTGRCITTIFISVIHKMYFSLYETMYNNNIYFSLCERDIITTNISVIRDDV